MKNQNYGLSIDYNEFIRTYTFVMNSTINEYMFTDASTKNAQVYQVLHNIYGAWILLLSSYDNCN